MLIHRVQAEEENIKSNLRRQLRQLGKEKVDLENQLEQEQEYITHKMSRQLREAIRTKNALQNQMEAERRATEELKVKIAEEERQLKVALQNKIEQLQSDNCLAQALSEKDLQAAVNKMTMTLEKLVAAKRYRAVT